MMINGHSTVATLCYETKAELDFGLLAQELAQALRDNPRVDCRISTQYEDFIIFDLSGVRICLAHCDLSEADIAGKRIDHFTQCLIVSVGNKPGEAGEGPLFEVRDDICRGLVERIENRHPSDRYMMLELESGFDEEVYDRVLGNIWPMLNEEKAAAVESGVELENIFADAADDAADDAEDEQEIAYSGALVLSDLRAIESGDSDEELVVEPAFRHKRTAAANPEDLLPDLEKRFEQELANRDAALRNRLDERTIDDQKVLRTVRRIRPTHPAMNADMGPSKAPAKSAVAFPDPPAPWAISSPNEGECELAERIRYALYPPVEELPDQIHAKSLTHRAAIYTINASVIAVSLPVGAAVMTYCILGRESLNVAARAMALTGTAMGFAQLEVAQGILNGLV